jgi:amino acid transporter
MKQIIFPFYLLALFFITRSSAIPRKTVMWMLITLLVIIAMFIGLAGLASSAEAAYGLGGLGALIGMIVSVAVGLKHVRSHKRLRPKPARQGGTPN